MKKCLALLVLLGIIGCAAWGEDQGKIANEVFFQVGGMLLLPCEEAAIEGGQRPRDEMTGSVQTDNIFIPSKSDRAEDRAERKKNNAAVLEASYDVGCAVVAVFHPVLGVSLFIAGRVRQCGVSNRER